jgi:2-polyprenyl-3-methyl-5-hydroxy-6-metoxy-1,4-benzoquinol methylase
MKKLLKRLIFNKFIARLLLKFILKIDKYLYFLIGQYSSLYYNGKHPKHEIIQYTEWFLSHIKKNWVVVDVGSNRGEMTIKLSNKVKKAFGIEIDENLYKISKTKETSKLEFFNYDATKFDYGKIGLVNCVTLSNVLEHIEDRVGFLTSLKNNVRFTNDPLFLIRVPMIDRHWVVILKKNLNVDYRLDETHFIEYTKETFFEEIKKCNLKVKDFEVRWGEIYAVVSI